MIRTVLGSLVAIALMFGPAFFGGTIWNTQPIAGALVALLSPLMLLLIGTAAEKQGSDWTQDPKYGAGQ